MFFTSFLDEKLAHYSYLVGCQKTGEAIVIDPSRYVNQYLNVAEKEGFSISAIVETHIHADFLSGSTELSEQSGAKIYLSDEGDENWKYQFNPRYNTELVKEGSVIQVGNVKIDVWHTPGHTPESISFVLTDQGGGSSVPMGIFTGDFVFVGDIGRPDLLEKVAAMEGTAQAGAKTMFQSVRKFKELPDHVLVWPAHGAGSACGKSLGAVPLSTVGYEKANNWALQIDHEDEFVKELMTDQPEAPKYFAMMKKLNKEGASLLPKEKPHLIHSINEMESEMKKEKMVIVDTRPSEKKKKNHIEGSLTIPLNKSFTNWAGWLLSYKKPILVIVKEEEEQEMVKALQSIGLDQIKAVFRPEIAEQGNGTVKQLTVDEFQNLTEYQLIDVRNDSEWKEGHLPEAEHIMLGTLTDRLANISKDKQLVVQCQAGGRSAIASSILQANGFGDVYNLQGGYEELVKREIAVS